MQRKNLRRTNPQMGTFSKSDSRSMTKSLTPERKRSMPPTRTNILPRRRKREVKSTHSRKTEGRQRTILRCKERETDPYTRSNHACMPGGTAFGNPTRIKREETPKEKSKFSCGWVVKGGVKAPKSPPTSKNHRNSKSCVELFIFNFSPETAWSLWGGSGKRDRQPVSGPKHLSHVVKP